MSKVTVKQLVGGSYGYKDKRVKNEELELRGRSPTIEQVIQLKITLSEPFKIIKRPRKCKYLRIKAQRRP